MGKNIFHFKMKIVIGLILLFLFFFSGIRLISIFILNGDYFQNMPRGCVFLSVAHGLRFDLYVAGVFLMPILLLLFIPFKTVLSIKLICVSAIIQITVLSLINYADTQYFNMFHNHLTVEIWAATGHIDFLIKFIMSNYLKSILIFFMSAILIIAFIIGKIGTAYGKLQQGGDISRKRYAFFLLLHILAAFVFIRGNLNPNDRPIRTLDAFLNNSQCNNTGGGIPPIFL